MNKSKAIIMLVVMMISVLTVPLIVFADLPEGGVELPSYIDFPQGVDPDTDRYTIVHRTNDVFNLIIGDVKINQSSPVNFAFDKSTTTHYTSTDLKEWIEFTPAGSSITFLNSNFYIVFASEDVKYGYETGVSSELWGTVFFSRSPAPYTKAIIRPLVQPQQMSQALSQILIILPLLLGLVVSFLAFRKAWSVLSNLLRKA